jgi:hypothetical protein
MSNPPEYANTTSTHFNLADDVNNPARYKCNNPIGTTTTDTYISINDAKNTYGKLYEIYNKYGINDRVTSIMFDNEDRDHCLIGKTTTDARNTNSAQSCPHNRENDNNLLAYTSVGTKQEVHVKDLKFYLDDCGARIRDYDKTNSTNASYKPVKDYATQFRDGSYNTLVSTRSSLDNKMNEILGNNKNSILYEKQGELDATVYSTLLWTVMVTSLLYYVFTKI